MRLCKHIHTHLHKYSCCIFPQKISQNTELTNLRLAILAEVRMNYSFLDISISICVFLISMKKHRTRMHVSFTLLLLCFYFTIPHSNYVLLFVPCDPCSSVASKVVTEMSILDIFPRNLFMPPISSSIDEKIVHERGDLMLIKMIPRKHVIATGTTFFYLDYLLRCLCIKTNNHILDRLKLVSMLSGRTCTASDFLCKRHPSPFFFLSSTVFVIANLELIASVFCSFFFFFGWKDGWTLLRRRS